MFVQSNTVRAVKEYFRDRLSALLSESEIRQVLNHALQVRLNLSRADMLLADDIRLSESDLLHFRSIVKRLQANEPAQYIFGDTLFAGLVIRCDPRALIPRPETEELVEWISAETDPEANHRILDVCTGTGCIALALKNALPGSEVHALDLSSEALALAGENIKSLKLDVKLHAQDALQSPESWPFEKESLDIIVSNPPYIPEEDKARMHANVLEFEPEMALFVSDENPLVFYEAIARAAKSLLKSEGKLFFELHEHFSRETLELIQSLGFRDVEIKLDLQGKKRMLKAIRE